MPAPKYYILFQVVASDRDSIVDALEGFICDIRIDGDLNIIPEKADGLVYSSTMSPVPIGSDITRVSDVPID